MSVEPTTTIHINTRLLNANEERLNTLTPLRGYAKSSCISLKEAVKSLDGLIHDIDTRVWTATNRSRNSAEKLTSDESAAIILYTIEWDPLHPSVYSVLNSTLRLENRDGLKPWFPYLKLLLSGLFKLPSVQCIVWRGVREDLSPKYMVGDFYTWWAFSSCTASISMLMSDRYLNRADSCTLFAIECLNGKNIKSYSYFAAEDEILLLPCTYFKVIDKFNRGDGLHVIHLREESTPHLLLEPPFPTTADSISDQLDNKQYEATLKELTKEKEYLANQCKEQQIQISSLQSENKALKTQCTSYEAKINSMEAIISQIIEDSEILSKEIQRLNEENKRIEEKPEVVGFSLEDSKNDTTELATDMIFNETYRYSVSFTIYTVDSVNTHLTAKGNLYVSVNLFGIHKQTKPMAPSLPLLINETLSFDKVFENCRSSADIIDRLEHENVLIELCQTTISQPVRLSIYEINAKDFLYPYSTDRIEYKGLRRSVSLHQTTNMSDISPTFIFSVSPNIDRISSTITQSK